MPWKQDYTISDEVSLADEEISWPKGSRCCLSVVVDLSPAVGSEGISKSDLCCPNYHYGMNEGLELVLGSLARRGLHATFAVPALLADIFPDQLRAVAAAGHEIAANGLLGEDVSLLDADTERHRLVQATTMIAELVGAAPRGWYALPRPGDPFATGNVSAATIELLIDHDYAYFGNGLADDAPHYWVTDFASRRNLLALPYYYHFDDRFFLMFPTDGTGLERPQVLARNWQAEFAAQYRRGRYFSLTISPARSGWGHRLSMLDAFLNHVTAMPGIWNATSLELAGYWSQRYPASSHLKLEPSIWKSYEGSLD